MDHNSGRVCYETYFPTQQPQTQPNPWISSPHGYQAGPTSTQSTPREGSSAVDAVAARGELDDDAVAPHGFPRLSRLTRPSQYGRVFARSKRSSDHLYTVLSRDNDGSGPRLGLAISKRAAKLAVQRNRLKRIAREVFRTQTDLPSMDFVVLAGAQAKNAGLEELRASLEKHFDRLARRPEPASHG